MKTLHFICKCQHIKYWPKSNLSFKILIDKMFNIFHLKLDICTPTSLTIMICRLDISIIAFAFLSQIHKALESVTLASAYLSELCICQCFAGLVLISHVVYMWRFPSSQHSASMLVVIVNTLSLCKNVHKSFRIKIKTTWLGVIISPSGCHDQTLT